MNNSMSHCGPLSQAVCSASPLQQLSLSHVDTLMFAPLLANEHPLIKNHYLEQDSRLLSLLLGNLVTFASLNYSKLRSFEKETPRILHQVTGVSEGFRTILTVPGGLGWDVFQAVLWLPWFFSQHSHNEPMRPSVSCQDPALPALFLRATHRKQFGWKEKWAQNGGPFILKQNGTVYPFSSVKALIGACADPVLGARWISIPWTIGRQPIDQNSISSRWKGLPRSPSALWVLLKNFCVFWLSSIHSSSNEWQYLDFSLESHLSFHAETEWSVLAWPHSHFTGRPILSGPTQWVFCTGT